MKKTILTISLFIIALNVFGQNNNNVNVEVKIGNDQIKHKPKTKKPLSTLLEGKNIEIIYTISAIEDNVDDKTFLGIGFNDIETDFYLYCKNEYNYRTLLSSVETPEIKKGKSASMKFILPISEIEICENDGGQVSFFADSSDISRFRIILTADLIQQMKTKGSAKRTKISIHSDQAFLFWDINTNNVKLTYDMKIM